MRFKRTVLTLACLTVATTAVALDAVEKEAALRLEKERLYEVYLNPFAVAEATERAIAAGYRRPTIPAIARESQREDYLLRNLDVFNYSPGKAKI